MNENLPQKYKESFFHKFIKKIKMFFSKTKEENKIENVSANNKIFEEKNDIISSLKVNFDTNASREYKKKEFMKNLSDNPELLENFSNDKLKRILKYYLDENEKKRELLKKIS